MEQDRKVVIVFSGSVQHVAITISIATSSPFVVLLFDAIKLTVLIMFVWSYRDKGYGTR